MILTICFLYAVVSIFSVLGFLFLSLEIHEIIFWYYELIPFGMTLIQIVKPVFSFVLAWCKFMWNICELCLCIIFHLFTYIWTLLSIGIPFMYGPMRVFFSFCKWMFSEMWRGIFVKGNPILSFVTGIIVTCSILLCIDNFFQRRHVNANNHQNRQVNILDANGDQNNAQQNENNENRHTEIRQRHLNGMTNTGRRNTNRDLQRRNSEDLHRIENNVIRGDNLHENQHDIDRDLCIICLENVRNYAVFPCGHLHFCGTCIESLFRERTNIKCPVCNVHIQEYRRIYV